MNRSIKLVRKWAVLLLMTLTICLTSVQTANALEAGSEINFDNAGTSSPVGTVIRLQDRGNGTKDLLLSSPLSIEINIDNNNSPNDEVVFTNGSGASREVIAVLTKNGDLILKGEIMTKGL